jgi:hypothetical protein
MLTYLGHLKHLRDTTTDEGDRAVLSALIRETEADIEFDQAGHTDRINGERAMRQRHGGPNG